MKRISLLGSTGSIGTQTLDVVDHHPEQFEIVALSAGTNVNLVIEQVKKYRPSVVSVATKELADELKLHIGTDTKVVYGDEGLIEVATVPQADTVVTAIIGSKGLPATLAAIDEGKTIGLANKETLVTAGHLVMDKALQKGVSILPIDSEHSAIFQCLNGESLKEVKQITLTASGGSFRDLTRDQLQGVTVEQALKHPNWSMGAKITIDSATMANKGLEVIEARWLFQLNYDQINVLIHPESIIHSFVEFHDHSVIAQLGMPDMRVPIQYALTYPNRLVTPTTPLDLAAVGKLNFKSMDFDRYPMLRLAFESGRAGLSAPAVFNAANEIAVDRFLKNEISFLDIEKVVELTLSTLEICKVDNVADILELDATARRIAASI